LHGKKPPTRRFSGILCAKRNQLLEFSPLDGLFEGIAQQPVIPFIVEGILGPDCGPQCDFKGIPAGFADITMGKVKKSPARNGLLHGFSAHITGKGLHGKLLKIEAAPKFQSLEPRS
jgi:hypothetical protein